MFFYLFIIHRDNLKKDNAKDVASLEIILLSLKKSLSLVLNIFSQRNLGQPMKITFLISIFSFIFCISHSKVMHFNWKSSGEGYTYKLQIARDSDKFENIFIEEVTSNTFYIIDIPPGRYYFRVIPRWKSFEGEPSFTVSFEIPMTFDPNKETVKDIYPPEVLDTTILKENEVLKLKPVFKNKGGKIRYNLNDLRNFREADEINILIKSLSNGLHSLYFKTISDTGKESKIKEYNFNIDRNPPEATITARIIKIGQKDYVFPDSFIEFDIFDEDPAIQSYIWINGKKLESHRFFVSKNDKTLRCTVFAMDRSGNVLNITKNFYVDTEAPKIFINSTNIGGRLAFKSDFLDVTTQDETSVSQTKIFIDDKLYYISKISLKEFTPQKYRLKIISVDSFFNTNKIDFVLFITNEMDKIKGYLYEEK